MKAWSRGGTTEPDNLAFGCKPDHKLHDEGWTTRLNEAGVAEWTPPAHLNLKPGVNNFHHPKRYLEDHEEDDP